VHRREDGGARTDDDPRLPARDPLPLVAPLGVGQTRVEDRDPVAEARREPAGRLRRQRDLGDEHDRAQPALEGGGARAEVDLGLAAAGGSREQEVRRRPERADDARDRRVLLGRQPLGRALCGQRLPRDRRGQLLPPLPHARGDERERPRRRRSVVLGEPEREVDERRRQLLDDARDRRDLDPFRRPAVDLDDDAALAPAPERNVHDRALTDPLGNGVCEDSGERSGSDEGIDGGEALDRPSVEPQHAVRADVRCALQCTDGRTAGYVRSALHDM
jgi:hypothetical protein